MSGDHNGRRQFLRGLGGFTLSLPLLPSLLPDALAQAALPKRRFISIGSSLGVYPSQWLPQVTDGMMTNLGDDVMSANLSAITGQLSPVFNAANYNDLKSKIMFVRGLDYCFNNDHNAGGVLAGIPGVGPSIDYVLSRSSKIYSQTPVVRNLTIAPHPKGTDSNSYGFTKAGDNWDRVAALGSVQGAFNLAFGGALNSNLATKPTKAELKKMVDRVYEDYRRVSGGRRISSEDKRRLEDHMTMLSEVEANLDAAPDKTCAPPTIETTSTGSVADHDKAIRAGIDIMVAALACGSTRIGTFKFNGDYYDAHVGGYHQTVSHQPDEGTYRDRFNKLYVPKAGHVSYMLKKLDAIQESDGRSLLYHSLVLWNNSLAYGDSHAISDLPVFLAGNAGGELTPGRFLDYRKRPLKTVKEIRYRYVGRPYNHMLVSIMQMMGLSPADYETAGVAGFGRYNSYTTANAQRAPYLTDEQKRAKLHGLKV